MIRAVVDPDQLFSRQLTQLEREQLPFAAMQAANATAFATKQRWGEVMPRVFDRPTALTLNAVLYTKATKARPYAEVFIRDEAFKGTPPAKYLSAQVQGGPRRPKGFERRLQSVGILPAGMFAVPGRGASLDAHGNLPGAQINAILSQLGARVDPLQNETAASGSRRRRRQARRGERRGDYFALKQARGRLQPGIYQRIATGFGSAVRSVLHFVSAVRYHPRYAIFDLAQRIYQSQFPFHFQRELDKAVQTAKVRGHR